MVRVLSEDRPQDRDGLLTLYISIFEDPCDAGIAGVFKVTRLFPHNRVVNHRAYPEVSPRVEYPLVELGQSLRPVIDALWDWVEDHEASLISLNTKPEGSLG